MRKLLHDLRSPLGTMKIWIHVLTSANLSSEDQARALQALQTSATALEELLDRAPYGS